MKKPAVFLDRDGVINRYPGDFKYVTSKAGFYLLPGAAEAVRRLNEAGFAVFVASNQAGVAKGIFSRKALDEITALMLRELEKEGAFIDGVYYCTHLQEEGCSCRKPRTGMIERALKDSLAGGTEIDTWGSFFVGDSIIDVQTGRQAGLTTVLVFSGREKEENRSLWQTPPHYTAGCVSSAVDLILELKKRGKAPDVRKKIVIAYASAGAGHRKAAEALFNYLSRHYPQCGTIKVDILKMSSGWFRCGYIYGYLFLVKYFPFLWSFIFVLTARMRGALRSVDPLRALNRLATAGFRAYLIRESPAAVINTHFLCSEITAQMKKDGVIGARIFTAITDFGVHPLWAAEGTDMYFAASERTRKELLDLDVPAERISVSGIPVAEEFIDYGRRRSAGDCRKGAFTILIATGSFGIGPFEKIIRSLFRDVGIIVVCAGNKRLYRRLKARNYPGVRVLGMIDNMYDVMAEADLIITKPGGLTISESMVMEVVPVFIMAIPGQEEENARFISASNAGFYLSGIKALRGLVLRLKKNKKDIAALRESIRHIKKINVLKDICDAVCQSRPGTAG